MTIQVDISFAEAPTQPLRPPLWMVKHEAFQGENPPCPAVVNLLAQPMWITKDWQFYLRAINYGMTLQKVSAILGHFRAFANGTGFGDPSDPRRDWLLDEAEGWDDPQFDKVRTCIRSVVTGHPMINYLVLTMLDGTLPPPIKQGRIYPETVAEIDIDDYLYSPRTHRWLFCAANIITADGRVVPFDDDGGVYDWMGDGRPYVFVPHVSRFGVAVPIFKLMPLAPDAPIPSPYYP